MRVRIDEVRAEQLAGVRLIIVRDAADLERLLQRSRSLLFGGIDPACRVAFNPFLDPGVMYRVPEGWADQVSGVRDQGPVQEVNGERLNGVCRARGPRAARLARRADGVQR